MPNIHLNRYHDDVNYKDNHCYLENIYYIWHCLNVFICVWLAIKNSIFIMFIITIRCSSKLRLLEMTSQILCNYCIDILVSLLLRYSSQFRRRFLAVNNYWKNAHYKMYIHSCVCDGFIYLTNARQYSYQLTLYTQHRLFFTMV